MKLLYCDADLNYELYSNGTAFPVGQSVRGLSLEMGRAISPRVNIAATVGYLESSIFRRNEIMLPPEFASDRDFELGRFSVSVERDLRDDNFYPTRGSHAEVTLTSGHLLGALGRTYSKAVLTARQYIPMSDRGVLALQATVCGTDDQAPFLDSCALGAVDAFRGYATTEFIGDALVSTQVEYRGRLTKRLGFVVFAGAGMVADVLAVLSNADVKLAGGVGARIRLSKEFQVDYAIDLAVNERGDNLLYISLGQRF